MIRFRAPINREVLRKLKPEVGEVVHIPGDSNEFVVDAVGSKFVRMHRVDNARDVRIVKVTEVLKKSLEANQL